MRVLVASLATARSATLCVAARTAHLWRALNIFSGVTRKNGFIRRKRRGMLPLRHASSRQAMRYQRRFRPHRCRLRHQRLRTPLRFAAPPRAACRHHSRQERNGAIWDGWFGVGFPFICDYPCPGLPPWRTGREQENGAVGASLELSCLHLPPSDTACAPEQEGRVRVSTPCRTSATAGRT